MAAPELPLTGGCQCSALRYEVTARPERIYVCHCTECRRQSASAFGISVIVPAAALRLCRGTPKCWSRAADSGRQVECHFCADCGTRIWHRDPADARFVSVKGGSLDRPVDLNGVMHIWTARRLPGLSLPPGAVSFPGEPDAIPVTPALRKAVAGDVGALHRLHQRAYAQLAARIGRKPEPMAADLGDLALMVGEDAVWLAESGGSLAGALVLRVGADHLLIWSVAVDPVAQRRGLGQCLLDFAEQEARRQGFAEIRLYTNERFTENIAIYRKIGYTVTRREETGFGIRVHMSKVIAARSP